MFRNIFGYSKLHIEEATKNPAAYYMHPRDVLADDKLKDEQKKKILESWHRDADALLRADSENMSSDDKSGKASKMLEAVCKSEIQLNEQLNGQV